MPGPFQSPAWNHLPEIRRLREERKSWEKIAEILRKDHGLKLDPTAIGRVFRRATEGKLPAGFPDPFALPETPRGPSPELAELPESPDDDGLDEEARPPRIIVS